MRPSPLTRRALTVGLIGVLVGGRVTSVVAHAPDRHGFDFLAFTPATPVPPVALPDLNGQPRTLAEFGGRFVLLNFWATWCPPCVKELPSMDDLYTQFRANGFEVVAIASDQEGESIVRPFNERLSIGFTILLDVTGKVSTSFGARELPTSFLLNPQGQVIAAARGESDWVSEPAVSYIRELLAGQ